IAIVDDNKSVREALDWLLRSLGHGASMFGSVENFFKSERLHDISCVLTDVQMPGLTGLDLQDRLIADGHRMPIIFMTAYSDDNIRARAMKAGAVGFLFKPFSACQLIGCIEVALQTT